jgi:hypothetical protein
MQSAGSSPTARKIVSDPRLHFALFAILSVVLSAKMLIFFVRAAHVVGYPYEWSTMDGYYVFYGTRLISGDPIYFGYKSLLMPFEYVPLYPAVIGTLARLFGNGVWYERAFSLLCAVGTSALAARAVNERTQSKGAAVLTCLLFFGPAAISVWYIVRGIDLFAAFLGLLGIAVVAGEEECTRRRLAVSIVIFVVAFYAKQTAVFPAGAAVVFIFSRNFKRGILMGILFAAGVMLVFLVIHTLSGGWFFENAFLTTSRNPYHMGRFIWFARDYFLCVPLVFLIGAIQAGRGVSRRPDVWSLYFVFMLASTLLAGKAGAALSYFVPLYSATCICAGLLLGDSALAKKRTAWHVAVVLLVLLQGGGFFRDFVPVPSEINLERARRLDRHVKEHPGRVLSERVDSFLVVNGRELNVEAVQLPSLIIRGAFDQTTLAEPIKEKDFSLIIYSGMYFRGLPEVRVSIFENYEVIDRISLGLFYGETLFLVMTPRQIT